MSHGKFLMINLMDGLTKKMFLYKNELFIKTLH